MVLRIEQSRSYPDNALCWIISSRSFLRFIERPNSNAWNLLTGTLYC